MIDGPGEGLVGVPVPAIFVGIGPTPDRIRAPIVRDGLRKPHIAEARMPDPLPVGRELVIESIDVDALLRRGRTADAEPVGGGQRQAWCRKECGPNERGENRSQPMSLMHSTPPGPRLGSADATIILSRSYDSFAAKGWRSDIFVN